MKNTILILVLCLFIGSCKDSLTVNEEVDTITASIEQGRRDIPVRFRFPGPSDSFGNDRFFISRPYY